MKAARQPNWPRRAKQRRGENFGAPLVVVVVVVVVDECAVSHELQELARPLDDGGGFYAKRANLVFVVAVWRRLVLVTV